ncbi:MAG: hypothetical protein GC201_11865, partial [Alphaproteobacteria bacterium]|nr:hypothetical protein [Alphaproteobacteria bacterium]
MSRVFGAGPGALLALALVALAPGNAAAQADGGDAPKGKACVVSGFKLTNKFGSTSTVEAFYVDRPNNRSERPFKNQTKNLEGGQSSSIKFDSKDTGFNNKEVWGVIEKKGCGNVTVCRKEGTRLYVELDPNNGNKPRGPIWHYKLEDNPDFCHSRC